MSEYDGRTPVRYCTCGCGVVISDGEWASNRRHHNKLMPRERRYGAYHSTRR